MNERISNWMKNERKEKKRKSQSSFLNFQAISEPCEATVLRGSVERERERERERCGSGGTPTATVTATPAELLRVVAMASLAGALTLSALQKISYSFLTSNLLTYLLTCPQSLSTVT
jgi:hypothetical protein